MYSHNAWVLEENALSSQVEAPKVNEKRTTKRFPYRVLASALLFFFHLRTSIIKIRRAKITIDWVTRPVKIPFVVAAVVVVAVVVAAAVAVVVVVAAAVAVVVVVAAAAVAAAVVVVAVAVVVVVAAAVAVVLLFRLSLFPMLLPPDEYQLCNVSDT